MFNKYNEKFGAVRMQRRPHPTPSGKKKMLGVRSLVILVMLAHAPLLLVPLVLPMPPLHRFCLEEFLQLHWRKQQTMVLVLNYILTWIVIVSTNLAMISTS